MEQSAVLEALLDPTAYPRPPRAVSVVRTHASLLFFAGERVYKVKRAVDLGFLDFSTLQRRRHFCAEEVRLNADLAPGVYRRVAAIRERVDADAGARVAIDGEEDGQGEIVEYAVEMVRLPADRMLDRLVEAGAVPAWFPEELVVLLREFHERAARGPRIAVYGAPEAVARKVLGNLEEATAHAGVVPDSSAHGAASISGAAHAHLAAWSRRFLDEHEELLRRRCAEGRIREGHGDLHAGNICLTEQGLVIYDRIEFQESFRCLDVAAEIAFLAMDLEFRAGRAVAGGLASAITDLYRTMTRDRDLPELQPLYRSHFAAVRGKVAALRARDGAEQERAAAWSEAAGYFNLAAGYTLPAALVVMCGLPGTGKSWAARRIASRLGAVHIASDRVRKELAGLPAERSAPGAREWLYSADTTARTYTALLEGARAGLQAGQSVVADATYSTPAGRAPILAMARELGVPAVVVHLDVPAKVVQERMRARASDTGEVSDADFDVYLRQRAGFEAPDEAPTVVRVGAAPHPEALVSRVVDSIVEG